MGSSSAFNEVQGHQNQRKNTKVTFNSLGAQTWISGELIGIYIPFQLTQIEL